MKVLEINSVCNGSTGRIACDIARELIKQGNECVLAYGRGNAPSDIKTIKIGNNFDVKYHGVMTRIFDKHGFYSKRSTKKFIKEVEKYNPDVIHLHNLHGYYINIEILFKYLKESKKKVIWTLHDCWTFTGHCSHFESKGCQKWKEQCYSCSQKQEYPASKIKDNSKNNYRRKKDIFTSLDESQLTIVTPSNWLANLAKESFLSKYNIKVINNGIDINIFKPTESNIKEKYGIDDKEVILGVASVWTEKKGLNDFIELASMLDDNFKIVLIGLNDKQLQEIPGNILGIKRTENVEELVKWYSCAKIFFNPTYEDTYPTVNLEAQACGTPVVTYNTGGSIETCCKENVINKKDYVKLIEILEKEEIKIYSLIKKNKEAIEEYLKLTV